MKDTAKITDLCHTGRLEGYHSVMLKYCAKPGHFSHLGIVARARLAALYNNHNTGCGQAVIKSGEQEGQAQYKLCFPEANKRWVAKPVTEKKLCEYLKFYSLRLFSAVKRET